MVHAGLKGKCYWFMWATPSTEEHRKEVEEAPPRQMRTWRSIRVGQRICGLSWCSSVTGLGERYTTFHLFWRCWTFTHQRSEMAEDCLNARSTAAVVPCLWNSLLSTRDPEKVRKIMGSRTEQIVC